MRELTPLEAMLAEQCAARHRIPKATVTHPAVIVPGDSFMTEKLRDPDYVPYCGPCTPMQRLRRVSDGFECPTCGNKLNYDLTKFNGNINVQYADPASPEESAEGNAGNGTCEACGKPCQVFGCRWCKDCYPTNSRKG